MRYIELNLDHADDNGDAASRVGSGWRRFIDLTGPRTEKAVLFYLPLLTQVRVPKATLRYAKEVPMTKGLARTLKARLKRNLRDAKRLGVRAPEGQVKAAIEKIEEELE